jgi:hypothetical protein
MMIVTTQVSRNLYSCFYFFLIEIHDEAERASRTAMAVIVPETNETSEVRIYPFFLKAFVGSIRYRLVMV